MVVTHQQVEEHHVPGLSHRTVAAGAATPVHRHDCEEAIVILEGHGVLIIEDHEEAFGPGSTLVIPRDAVHQVRCTGPESMRLVAALGAAPVRVHTAANERIPLPWDAPDSA